MILRLLLIKIRIFERLNFVNNSNNIKEIRKFVIIMLFNIYVFRNVEQEPDQLTPAFKKYILLSRGISLTIGIFFLIFVK
jgi:hypothetical protein